MTDEENLEDFVGSFDGEIIDVSDVDLNGSRENYFLGEPLELDIEAEGPVDLEEQVKDMREKSDLVKDFLDIYDRFQNEDWDQIPSEIEGFLKHHGYEQSEDPLKWLTDKGAEASAKLYKRKELLSDVYHGVGILDSTDLKLSLDEEDVEKVDAEFRYASSTIQEVKHAGATTEGGWTEPYPKMDVERQYSLGHQFRKKRDELQD